MTSGPIGASEGTTKLTWALTAAEVEPSSFPCAGRIAYIVEPDHEHALATDP
ncbi:MAG: hypothetical protein IT381_28075 [Deltaproteobacteria bacterium]|nr:hypothetical protein [Deltaproteobacteria bacterium]